MRSKFYVDTNMKPLTMRNDPDGVKIHTANSLKLSQEEAFRLADLLVDHAEQL